MSNLSDKADEDGEVTKDEFQNYAKHSEFFKNQLGLSIAIILITRNQIIYRKGSMSIFIIGHILNTLILDKNDSDSIASKRESGAKAERAFKLFDKDNDGFITKEEFQKISKKLNKQQVLK